MNSLERELETIHLENEGLKKKQVKLDEQLMENSVVGTSREGCSSLPELVCEGRTFSFNAFHRMEISH